MNPGRVCRNAGRLLSACVAVSLAAAQAVVQLPVIDLSGRSVETLIPPEFEGGFFHRIGGMVVRDDGLWVLDAGQGRVFRFDATGRPVVAFGIAGTIAIFGVPDSPGMETETPQLSVNTVAMGIAGRPVTRADRERAEADFRRNNPNVRGQVIFEGWPTHWFVAINLLVSDDGRAWVRRVVRGDERQHWTEVDLQGPLRRQVILPERFSLRAIMGGKLYGVASDETGCSARGGSGSAGTTSSGPLRRVPSSGSPVIDQSDRTGPPRPRTWRPHTGVDAGKRHSNFPWGPAWANFGAFRGAIAQLGERWLCKPEVTGSIPVGSTFTVIPRFSSANRAPGAALSVQACKRAPSYLCGAAVSAAPPQFACSGRLCRWCPRPLRGPARAVPDSHGARATPPSLLLCITRIVCA